MGACQFAVVLLTPTGIHPAEGTPTMETPPTAEELSDDAELPVVLEDIVPGNLAALNVPEAIFVALVVSVVAEGAKLTPPVVVTDVTHVAPVVVASPVNIGSCEHPIVPPMSVKAG